MSPRSPRPSRPGTAGARRLGLGAAIAGLLVVLLAAGCAVLAWPQAFGLELAFGVSQLIAFRGPLLIVGAVGLLLSLLLLIALPRGRRGFAVATTLVLAAFVLAQAGVMASRGLGSGDVSGDKAEGSIRVLAWNTRGDEPGSPTIADLAIAHGADIVALPETTEEMGEEVANLMGEAGRPMWVHTIVVDPDYKWTSTTLLISPELGDYEIDASRGGTTDLPTVIATPVDGEGPTIIAAHPIAPVPSHMAEWRSDLEWLALQCRGDAIVAGDFNSTLDHLAGFGDDGHDFGECDDAAVQAGSGANGTWPAGVPPILASPIDHVMATDQWRATRFEVVTDHDLAGSDHRPVLAELAPAR
ncbi:hypothetical protein USB125703_01449 [Pseudoclavibacter triregionum]|nr:hypothetical protein USB125703_01449 [Pseudoclavibacter triregionum]